MAVFVLDAAALLNNEGFSFDAGHSYYCPNGVFDEWKDFRSKALAENAFASGVLRVVDACPLSVSQLGAFLRENGLKGLSAADGALLALAFELLAQFPLLTVVSDDFGVQNVCKLKKIRFVGVAQGKITRARRF
ncbi:MAG: hypothetical protein Q7R47_02980, partial [Candidatus Diapherotrites archaeon]|nr:hypothetical protein [Candidatus Diapherotrites archaeon]